MRSKLTEWERFKVSKILIENRWFSENSLPVNVLKNDSFHMFQQILAIFMATKTIEKNWQFFRCFNRFWPFSGYKTHWQKLTIFQMFQHILASFLATKLIEKWLTVFRCFNRYWPFFWQQNPLKKIDSFSDVSPDFGHFSSDKTHWKKLTVFRCFNGFWPFLWRRTLLKKMTAFQMFQQILAIFWRQNPLTRSVPASYVNTRS